MSLKPTIIPTSEGVIAMDTHSLRCHLPFIDRTIVIDFVGPTGFNEHFTWAATSATSLFAFLTLPDPPIPLGPGPAPKLASTQLGPTHLRLALPDPPIPLKLVGPRPEDPKLASTRLDPTSVLIVPLDSVIDQDLVGTAKFVNLKTNQVSSVPLSKFKISFDASKAEPSEPGDMPPTGVHWINVTDRFDKNMGKYTAGNKGCIVLLERAGTSTVEDEDTSRAETSVAKPRGTTTEILSIADDGRICGVQGADEEIHGESDDSSWMNNYSNPPVCEDTAMTSPPEPDQTLSTWDKASASSWTSWTFYPDNISGLASGKLHSLALDASTGRVFAWGSGSRGELGSDSLDSRPFPALVRHLVGNRIVDIAAGGWHSAAISDCGDLFAWGWNEAGQVGLDPETHGSVIGTPTIIPLHPGYGSKTENGNGVTVVENVSAAAKSEDNGTVAGSGRTLSLKRRDALTFDDCSPTAKTPLDDEEMELDSAVKVACGSRHTLALTEEGRVFGFGSDRWGQCTGRPRVIKETGHNVSEERVRGSGHNASDADTSHHIDGQICPPTVLHANVTGNRVVDIDAAGWMSILYFEG